MNLKTANTNDENTKMRGWLAAKSERSAAAARITADASSSSSFNEPPIAASNHERPLQLSDLIALLQEPRP